MPWGLTGYCLYFYFSNKPYDIPPHFAYCCAIRML
ncbi:hypothetical protein BVI2075_960023 [Burkholderia vietnamiensis]|nr:hypothetical protein BVI2075_960023 [Burkholderia vietnamiensis]